LSFCGVVVVVVVLVCWHRAAIGARGKSQDKRVRKGTTTNLKSTTKSTMIM